MWRKIATVATVRGMCLRRRRMKRMKTLTESEEDIVAIFELF